MREPAEAYARARRLRLRTHDDASLPPLWMQLRTFAAARVIVAPIGAAEINMVASARGACVVELVGPQPVGVGPDDTYASLAAMLGHVHKRVALPTSTSVDKAALADALGSC